MALSHNTGALIFSDTEAAHLAAAASWPVERQGPGLEATGSADIIAHHLAVWRDNVAKGDVERFERVLRWRGLDPTQAAAQLAPARAEVGAPRPTWLVELQGLLARDDLMPGVIPWFDPAAPLPHEALLGPIIARASLVPQARLRALGSDPTALAPMQRDAVSALGQMAGEALAMVAGASDPLRAALLEHPVLARLLARFCTNWAAAITEMLVRLEADAPAIVDFLGSPPGPPISFETTDADGHDGGRMVILLSFQNDQRLVYKPRDLQLDVGFAELLRDLTGRGLDLHGAVPRCLARPGYGWAEFIRHSHAPDAKALARLWRRSGQLLGVLTALGGVDMHAGNVIAAGDRLVLIDLETVLTAPMIEPPDLSGAAFSAVAQLERLLVHSPLYVGMLPVLVRQQGAGQTQEHGYSGAFGPQGRPGATHRATSGQLEAELHDHCAEVGDGFAQALRVMREAAPALTAPDGALAALAKGQVRVLFRDTRLYDRLLRSALQPACLGDGAAWDVHLEQLARMLAPYATPPRFTALVEPEKRALAELDIPRFHFTADGTDLMDQHGVVVPGMVTHGPLSHARRRLDRLRESDVAFHRREVAMALQLRILGHDASDTRPELVGGALPLDGALAIARSLRAIAIAGDDDTLTWHCPRHHTRIGAMELVGFNFGLADGTLGIAVFLAALAAVHPNAETRAWRDGAIAALRPVDRAVGHTSLVAPQAGLLEGLGGEAWGYATLARLGAPGWCAELAHTRIEQLLRMPVGTDWSLASGLAGGLLAALAVHRLDPQRLPTTSLSPLIDSLTDHLAATGPGADPGLMLGVAGVTLALRRAAIRTGKAVQAAEWPNATAAKGGWGRGALGVALARGEAPDVAAAAAALGDGLWRGRAGLLCAWDAAGQQAEAAALAAQLAGHACAGTLRPVLPAVPGVLMPGLTNGVAGIGYTLLRHLRPDLPDLALFD